MTRILIRELWGCTPEMLARKCEIDIERAKSCITALAASGVLKLKTDNRTKEYEQGNQHVLQGMYQFVYVGIAIFEDLVLVVYPKYLEEEDVTPTLLRTVLKALRKSSKGFAESPFVDESGQMPNNRLALMLTLLEMYEEHGLYENEERILRFNGGGEINWERTIARHDAFLSSGTPIYLDFETDESSLKTADFITRLHRFVLTESSKFLQDNGLNELLGLDELELTDEEFDSLGDFDTMMYKLEQERVVQFVTWKQRVLELLMGYVNAAEILAKSEEVLCLGTTSFYHVWEEACCVALGDISRTPIKKLGIDLKGGWTQKGSKSLLELMPAPRWYRCTKEGEAQCGNAATLIPDALTLWEDGGSWLFGIFDAKYYTPTLSATVNGAPGVGDITKQQLYQSAYKKFVLENGIHRVVNIFLIPSNGNEISKVGRVEFADVMGLEVSPFVNGVTMYSLPANTVLGCYIRSEKLPDEVLVHYFWSSDNRFI